MQKEISDPMRYQEIAQFYIEAYKHDMQQLACLPPTGEPRVTEHIKPIIAFIEGLVAQGHAYVSGGDVYFSIETFPEYGKLSKRNIDEMIAGARVSINEKKRDPLDFALWKGESEGTFWQSPWGWGRPGWHIECSALVHTYLGEPVDIMVVVWILFFLIMKMKLLNLKAYHNNRLLIIGCIMPLCVSIKKKCLSRLIIF